jgi:hypothetical protein
MPEWAARVPPLHVEIPKNLECPSRELTFVWNKGGRGGHCEGEERGCQSVDASVIPSECLRVRVWVRVCRQPRSLSVIFKHTSAIMHDSAP